MDSAPLIGPDESPQTRGIMGRRHQTGLVGLFLVVAGVLLVMGRGVQKSRKGSASFMSRADETPSNPMLAGEEDEVYFETAVTMTDLLNLPEVASYIDFLA